MTNSSHLEINAAQWHRTRLEQLLEHPNATGCCFWASGDATVCCFAALGRLVAQLSIFIYPGDLRWFLCTLQLSALAFAPAGWRDRAARRCGRRRCHLHREACSTMSGPSLSRVVALIDMDCFCAPPHTHATPQHTHLCNLPEQLPIPASSRLRLRTGARLIARGRAVSGGAVQPFPGRWLRQRLGSRLPAR